VRHQWRRRERWRLRHGHAVGVWPAGRAPPGSDHLRGVIASPRVTARYQARRGRPVFWPPAARASAGRLGDAAER
jgi:hypothetical protein